MVENSTIGMSKDEKLIAEAKRRYKQGEEWEAEARINYLYDMRFANGDSQNLYQWPNQVSSDRSAENRPCLTINKTKQHCLQIINDQRQNPSQIEVRPVGDGASYEAARIFEGICRHIEYISNAQQAYNNACYHQVLGGLGYWRVTTDYVGADSFDQEIMIRRVGDPLSVYLDPDIQEADGSDARWAILFKDMPKDEFALQYPNDDDIGSNAPLGVGSSYDYDAWENNEHVRVAEYFRKTMKSDKLHELHNGLTVRESDARDRQLMAELKANSVQSRDIETPEIEWYLIGGGRILDRKSWIGKYIPIVRVIGEETVIDKVLDRKGHVRALIDPQRIYNYWSSSAVEFVALQTKSPFIAAIESIRGFEENWARANLDNKAYLPFNALDENGQKLERPERAPVPVMATAYIDGLKIAAGEMMLVSGQYEANMGQKSNEVSGKAVDARERQGDNSSFHFIDRFASAIRFTGRILIDLIPKIYDTKRIVKIMAENGDESSVHLDPGSPVAHRQMQEMDSADYDREAIQAVFNPTIGTYDVIAEIGPNYATRRQESFAAIGTILQENQQLTPVIGDLLFRAADFPMAEEIAERLHNMVPPQALGEGPNPEVQQLQQMLAQQHQAMTKMDTDLQTAKLQAASDDLDKRLKEYEAETNRMKAIGAIDPESFKPIIRQLVSEALGTPINPIIHAHAQQAAALPLPPIEQAKLDHASIKLEHAKVTADKAKTTAKKTP